MRRRAVDLATCDLPADDPGAICAGGAQHPEIATGGAGGIALSYAIVPLEYWTRLAIVPWPDLP